MNNTILAQHNLFCNAKRTTVCDIYLFHFFLQFGHMEFTTFNNTSALYIYIGKIQLYYIHMRPIISAILDRFIAIL